MSTAPLQHVLNSATLLVCNLRPLDRVTEALINLHWLPVTGCIEFKLCILVYKSLNGIAPSYIDDMIQPVSTLQRQVIPRSATINDLFVPRARLRFGERAFSIAAPLLWNSLPAETRNVATLETSKKKLKTFMFYNKHFGD